MTTLLPTCLCGRPAAREEIVHGIPVLQCLCGIRRQDVRMTAEELDAWYARRYATRDRGPRVGADYYRHDRAVAVQRLAAYALPAGARVLDVGCSNGAFVDEAVAQGYDAWGQDIAEQSDGPRTYVGQLQAIAFPTARLDVVTMHDVLEHVRDPAALLAEIARILKPGGRLILDFPHFYHEAGKHHWRMTEHLWFLTAEELVALVTAAGFGIGEMTQPIAGKLVLSATRLTVQRPQLLVPAGIGDAYWVLTKLPGFLRTHGLDLPDLWVQDQGGPLRTQPYLETIPFVHAAGYRRTGRGDRVWDEAYMRDGRTAFPGVWDADWFLAYNGVLRHGRSLEDVDPQYGCHWHPPMHISKAAREYRELMQMGGPYVVGYFASGGMYQRWLGEFPQQFIEQALQLVQRTLGVRIVIMGAAWDKASTGHTLATQNGEWTNLIGETTFDQMLGLLLGATAVVGWPAGNTILAAERGVPTVLIWNRYFDVRFWRNAVPPDARYAHLNTKGLTAADVLAALRIVL